MSNRLLSWTDEAWNSYVYWQTQDKKTLKRINKLISDVKRSPFEGIGKPEPLKENLSGFWSRRIDDTNRLVYAVDDTAITVISCRYHYQQVAANNHIKLLAGSPGHKQVGSASQFSPRVCAAKLGRYVLEGISK